MPHIRIDYSANLDGRFDGRALALRIHERLAGLAGADIANCKTRLIRRDETVIGDGSATNAMLHVDIRMLAGRSDAQKRALGEAVMVLLRDAVEKPEGMALQISAEIGELDRLHYHKQRL